jgi:cytochrome c oxidase subunit 2
MRRTLLLSIVASALTSVACTGVQPILAPGGPEARGLADLGLFVLVVFVAVSVIMWALIFWLGVRRRGTLAEHAPVDVPGDKRWLLVGGFIIPAVILGVMFVLTLRTMSAYPMGDDEMNMPPPPITVIGHQWWWEVHYQIGPTHEDVVTANEIHIPAGQRVDIGLQSDDVIHSFWVPRLHGKVDLVPGFSNRIRLQADQPGLFRGECAEFCGPQHAKMILTVQADAPADFEAWLQGQRQPAAPPASDFAARGRDVFMHSACAACHTIRGTEAHGLVGPDLTHLASRKGIAASAYPNTKGYLAGWVTHAQTMKPGAQMPNITAFDGEELRALVTFLEGLR